VAEGEALKAAEPTATHDLGNLTGRLCRGKTVSRPLPVEMRQKAKSSRFVHANHGGSYLRNFVESTEARPYLPLLSSNYHP